MAPVSWIGIAPVACLSVCLSVASARSDPAAAAQGVGVVDYVATKGQPTDEDATDAEIRALRVAASIVNAVKSSACFREFIAGRALIETGGRTPDQVAMQLQALRGIVHVAFYYRCSTRSQFCPAPTSAVAYRQPPEQKIFVNRAFFDVTRRGFDPYELAGTLAHEGIGHLLGGYGHPFEWTPSRDFSVPYSISGASRANDDAFQHCRKTVAH